MMKKFKDTDNIIIFAAASRRALSKKKTVDHSSKQKTTAYFEPNARSPTYVQPSLSIRISDSRHHSLNLPLECFRSAYCLLLLHLVIFSKIMWNSNGHGEIRQCMASSSQPVWKWWSSESSEIEANRGEAELSILLETITVLLSTRASY